MCLVSLLLCEAELPSECSVGIVLAFDRKGNFVRKFPEVEIMRYRDQCKLCCLIEEGVRYFRVLFSPHSLTLSAVYHSDDVDRLFGDNPGIQIAETELMDIREDLSLCLTTTSGETFVGK